MDEKGNKIIKNAHKYWNEIVGGDYEKINLCKLNHKEVAQYEISLNEDVVNKIDMISKGQDVIKYIIILTAYKIVLGRVAFNMPTAIGITPYIKGNKGDNLFLVSNNTINKEDLIKECLLKERSLLLEQYKNQGYPLESLYRDNNVYERINAYCSMENLSKREDINQIEQLETAELVLNVKKENQDTILQFISNGGIDKEQLGAIYRNIEFTLEQMLEDVNCKIKDIKSVPDEEYDKLVNTFNETKTNYPKDKSISMLFEEWVDKYPDHTAIVFEDTKITYGELDKEANKIANMLLEAGVKPKDTVGLIGRRSIQLMASILGILKVGAVYLPIDFKYPNERINYMIEDTNVQVLIADMSLTKDLDVKCTVLNMYPEKSYSDKRPNIKFDGDELAYIIYTSGSTGKPKGVLIKQYSVIRVVRDTNYIQISPEDKILQLSSYVFDGSVFDIYGALLNGATLVIPNENTLLEVNQLATLIEEAHITVFFVTTALFNVLVDMVLDKLAGVRKILFGGERVSFKHVKRALEKLGPNKLIHVYGPTESTVYATYYPINNIPEGSVTIPIGKALANTSLYILGAQDKLQPIGMPGELCIGGDGLAVGYLNRPELTSEKFVKNPFNPDEYIYRTGDLVRYLESGDVEFIGRIDSQVKIRGFRIELGEIESVLISIPDIKEAVVLIMEEENEKCIYAYYVAEKPYTEKEIKELLKQKLPSYMIPTRFIAVDRIPLTINGKVDKRKLSKQVVEKSSDNKVQEAPASEEEAKIIEIYKEVLNRSTVLTTDNFFEIGGHSLNAIKVIGEINKAFDIEMTLREFFTFDSIKQVIQCIEAKEKKSYSHILQAEPKVYYEASPAQKRIYMVQEMNKNLHTYNITEALELVGNMNTTRLEKIIYKIIEKREILRTCFKIVDGKVVQQIKDMKDINFSIQKVAYDATRSIDEQIKSFVKPFDLSEAPLLRMGVMSIDEQTHILLVDIHHIIADGSSLSILLNEISLYDKNNEIQTKALQYKDYSEWYISRLQTSDMQHKKEYWLDVFKGELPSLDLPYDYKRNDTQSFRGNVFKFKIDKACMAVIRQVMKEEDVTLYVMLLASYNILLSKYSGQEDIIVGSVLAGRDNVELQDMLGMIVNTIAMRNYPKQDKRFSDYLKEVKENFLRAYENQDYQIEDIASELQLARDYNRNILFNTMLVLENIEDIRFHFEDLQVRGSRYKNDISKFDMTWVCTQNQDELEIEIEYCVDLFKEGTIAQMARCFSNILEQAAAQKDMSIRDIKLLNQQEENALIKQAKGTELIYEENVCIQEFFERQAAQNPGAIAVVDDEKKITYGQLNERANQLAAFLRKTGVSVNMPVAIMQEKGINMMIAILGILKAGAAYVPIDLKYPKQRIEYILSDSKAKYMIVNKIQEDEMFNGIEQISVLDEQILREEKADLEVINTVNDTAYIIYTSGSTGKPKGVAVAHKGLANLKVYFESEYDISAKDHILQFANYCFDAAVWEMSMALLIGGSLYLVSNDTINDLSAFETYLNTNQITVATLPPAYATNINSQKVSCLRVLITAGSQTHAALVDKWKDKVKYINAYGPTETTVCATAWIAGKDEMDKQWSIPIGKPISNMEVYIVGHDGNMQPVGVAGELCIGGIGLAKGYVNNEALTNEKFIINPYKEAEKVYRTGDKARWLENGNIEFLGRIDCQVKIRGYRIELEEIERQLIKHPDIQEVVVLAKDIDTDPYLVAYIVGDKKVNQGELKEFLAAKLPHYMIPSYYVQLEQIPKNQSDKPNKNELLKLPVQQTAEVEIEAPTTSEEEILLAAWKEIFKLDNISINDDFFNLGGDSIKAIKASYILNEKGLTLKLADIFKYRTIKKLAEVVVKIKQLQNNEESTEGEIDLTPIQRWFIDKKLKDPEYFNQAIMLRSTKQLDLAGLEEAFRRLQDEHDSLRTRYSINEGKWSAEIVKEGYPLDFSVINIYSLESDEALVEKTIEDKQGSIDLLAGPMMHSIVFKGDKEDYIYIMIHHMAVDTVSWGVLLSDLESLYNNYLNGQSYHLPHKTLSIRSWIEVVKEYSNSPKLLEQKEYWKGIQSTEIKKLPLEYSYETNLVKESSNYVVTLSKEETSQLLSKSKNEYKTGMVDLLVAALSKTLKEWTGYKHQAVMFEGHGREEILQGIDIQRTVGWFTSIYPVILDAPNTSDIVDYLNRTIIARNRIPQNGMGYLLLKYMTNREEVADIDWSMMPQISFNYQGDLQLEGKEQLFEMIDHEYGRSMGEENERFFDLEFNEYIYDGKLNINVTYNPERADERLIKKLGENYRDNLVSFIELEAKEIKEHSYDEILEYIIEQYEIPGAIIGVQRGNDDVHIMPIGKANVKSDAPMMQSEMFKVGSITKTFTATLIMQLVEEGLINLDASVVDYIPEIVAPYGAEHFKAITVRKLLQHTSGLKDYVKNTKFLKKMVFKKTKWKPEQILQYGLEDLSLLEGKEDIPWIYSSTGYILLGFIIQKVTGKKVEDLVQQRICEPLGLSHTRMANEIDVKLTNTLEYTLYNLFYKIPQSDEFSHCYIGNGKRDVTRQGWDIGWTAGNIVSNMSDLLKWSKVLSEGTLLKDKEHMKDYIDVSDYYPDGVEVEMGLGIFKVNDMLGHEGHGVGFQNAMYVDEDTSYVIHVNRSSDDPNNLLTDPFKIFNEFINIYR